jgi:predicted transcriptional regulator
MAKVGRRGKYHSHVEPYLDDIKKLRREGAIEADIAKRLKVSQATFSEYKKKYPELVEALKTSTLDLVHNIKQSLYTKALGGFVKTKRKYKHIKGKKICIQSEEEVLAPDNTAIAMALKILDPEAREVLSTNTNINVENTALENFKSFSEQMKEHLDDE